MPLALYLRDYSLCSAHLPSSTCCLPQLEAVLAERDGLREDVRGFRDSKRQADQSWREERRKVEALETELNFYQGEFAGAMADRDKVGSVLEHVSLSSKLSMPVSACLQSTAELSICQ